MTLPEVAPARRPEPAVEFRNVSKTFPGQKALDGVSFGIAPSSIHALLGHNGSGKTTLIKVLAGVHHPDPDSEVLVSGSPMDLGDPRAARRRGLRFVHQDLGLIAELNTAENMALTWEYPRLRGRRIDWPTHARNVRAALDRLGVQPDLSRPVGDLRAVDRTAVAIARALGEPDEQIEVLVLDEPTAALPPAEVESLFTILEDIRQSGVSILYVSHRLGEILELADQASILRDGVLRHTVTCSAVDQEQLVELILGDLEGQAGPGPAPVAEEGQNVVEGEGLGPATRRPLLGVEVSASILRNVSLDLHGGEILGVAGLAGSGREELCEAIVGAVPATTRVRDDETGTWHENLTPARARDLGIALVLPNRQPGSAVPQFSVKENISLPSMRQVGRRGLVRHRTETALARTWMARLDIRPPDPEQLYALLSGGNQQKTVFAKWLAISPRALLLEDPTTGVDVGSRSRIYDLIREQAGAGLTVLVASSDLEDLVALCDRVVVLARGRIIEELTRTEIDEQRLLDSLNRVSSLVGAPHA
ncbi:MAG TPA: sugar ABC transporter ATP-binding protein [Acidimicrobiales bacterium]|nr:sugar ABC transporter ATP-binding protein [Acidimicrobiales bacterium]